MKLCRHCGKRQASRPRGLCNVDYYAPGVRQLYPVDPRSYQGQGVGDSNGPSLPCTPTDTPRGSRERIKVLKGRAERREALHHPQDSEETFAELLDPFEGDAFMGGDWE